MEKTVKTIGWLMKKSMQMRYCWHDGYLVKGFHFGGDYVDYKKNLIQFTKKQQLLVKIA